MGGPVPAPGHDGGVDGELERLITRGASTDHGKTADEREKLWKAGVRAHHARRRAENAAAWLAFHRSQADSLGRTLEALIAHHEERASKLQGGAA